jgi:hypothetical protein
MNEEDKAALYILLGAYLLNKYQFTLIPALQNAGVRFYEMLHDDMAHQKDLPGKGLPRQAVLDLARATGFPDPKLAAAIALAESGGISGAILRSSREYSVGLWQINTMVHPYTPEEMKDPVKNALAAFKISKAGSNWTPWSTYKNGRYKHFLTGILA